MAKKPNLKIMKKINADRVVSVSAIVVSVATVIMIFYQTNLMRQEQKSSVMPSLSIGYGKQGSNPIKERIYVQNYGLGPAFIEDIMIIDSTGKYNVDLHDYFKKINSNEGVIGIRHFFEGLIIPKNEGMTLYLKRSDSTSQVILSNYFDFAYTVDGMPSDNPNKAIIEIYYKSVYDDHWMISSDKSIPKKIE